MLCLCRNSDNVVSTDSFMIKETMAQEMGKLAPKHTARNW